ncbi:hypothetical protein NCC49_006434 [Naganishia albida]|nr:hypothetical protein NCC49_006434 [Naganishia albida]
MKLATHTVLAITGLAAFASAIPIRIVHIDAVAPFRNIDVGTITHTPHAHAGSSEIGAKVEGFSSNWWKEFTEKYAIASPSSEGYPALPAVKHGKWHSSHHRLGGNDHYIPQTDASLVPEWMYSTPLSSARYTPVVARPGREGMDRVIKVVMGPDGVVMYQVGEGQGPAKVHGGIGCVFRSFKRMVQSLSPHELVIFTSTTILMLLVILRLALLSFLLIRRAHEYANEYPGAQAAREREEERARKEDEEALPRYTPDVEEVDEKDGLLPPYSESS